METAPVESSDQLDASHLFRPGSGAPTRLYLGRLWNLRHFIHASARGRLLAKNRGFAIGNAWLLLEPALTVAVYFFIFSVVLDVSRGVENFLLFLVVGRAAFSQHQAAVLGAATSLSGSPAILRNTTIPRAALPIGTVIGTLYQWSLDLAIIAIVVLATWEQPQLRWLLVVPISLGMAALNMAMALWLSPILAEYQDLRRAMPTVYRLAFYVTGVMFPIEAYIEGESYESTVQTILYLNPIYGYVKALQYIFVGFDLGTPRISLLISIAWTVVLFPTGLFYFIRRERRQSTLKQGVR